MEHINVFRIEERDFDNIIVSAGGHRVSKDESREESENADYLVDDVLIELKIVEEEPTRKALKQERLASLFGNNSETVVIDPQVLDESGRKRYYRIIESPIKQHIKKAASQLKQSQKMLDLHGPRIAILINNGLYALSREEFESAAIRCASNDTSAVDILFVGGMYYYSDTYDMYLFPRLSSIYMNGHFECRVVDSIRTAWDAFVERYMRQVIVDTDTDRTKEPVTEIAFEVSGVRYVKPAPRMPASDFWPDGIRPRIDSTGQDVCPPVARVLPLFSPEAYRVAMGAIIDKERLHKTLAEYNKWCKDQAKMSGNQLCPIVGCEVPATRCTTNWFADLCDNATQEFTRRIRDLLDTALRWSETHISLDYILVTSQQIGIDKANDLAWMSAICEIPGFERRTDILCAKRMKFEYALALAGAYAILHQCPQIYYIIEELYPPGRTTSTTAND